MKNMTIIDLKTIEKKEILSGYKVRFVHSDNITFAFWEVMAGSILPKHSHIQEQILQVTVGEFGLIIDGKTSILKQGKVAIIPSNIEHSGIAITDCKITDTFYPLRDDYM